jgi:hypothetical protein
MRPKLQVTNGFLESVLGDGAGGVEVGLRLRANEWLDFSPHTVVAPGETGTVDYVDEETGLVEVKLDKLHRGLNEWDNHLWLVPFETEARHLLSFDIQGNPSEGEGVPVRVHLDAGEIKCSLLSIWLCALVWAEWLL